MSYLFPISKKMAASMSFVENYYRKKLAEIESHRDKNIFISESTLEAICEHLETCSTSAPLYGVAFAVKDNIDVKGMETTCACPDFAFKAESSNPVVKRLMELGAVPIGKTNMDQFATGLVGTRSPYGVTENATYPGMLSGGSSSGSASAVSLGLAEFSLGTDTAGSGRIPAAFQGLVGVKPSRGSLSMSSVFPACRSLDCLSLIAKDIITAEKIWEWCAFYDDADVWSRKGKKESAAQSVTAGVICDEEAIFQGGESYGEMYSKLKADLENAITIDFLPFQETANLLYSGPWLAERYNAIRPVIEDIPESLFPRTRDIIEKGADIPAWKYFQAQDRLKALQHDVKKIFKTIDVLVLPSAPGFFSVEEEFIDPSLNTLLGTYTNFVNLLDLCALTIPYGTTDSGNYQASLTLIAPAWKEKTLFSEAAKLLGIKKKEKAPTPVAIENSNEYNLAVMGLHMRGQALHYQLENLEAEYCGTAFTSRAYKMYLLQGDKPGILRDEAGGVVECELFRLTPEAFSEFVSSVLPPLSIGQVELSSGLWVNGFLLADPSAIRKEIPQGSWKDFHRQSAKLLANKAI